MVGMPLPLLLAAHAAAGAAALLAAHSTLELSQARSGEKEIGG